MSVPGHEISLSYQYTTCEGKQSKDPKESVRTADLNSFSAGLNMLKFIIGIGIISLPEATKHVGSVPSVVGLGIVAFVTVWGIFLAIQCHDKLAVSDLQDAADTRIRTLSEGDSLRGNWRDRADSSSTFFDRIVVKVLGPHAQVLFAASIALGQFTTCVIYVDVILQNLQSYFPLHSHDPSILIGIIVVLAVFLLIPTFQGIAVLSALGLSTYVFLFVGLLIELINKMQSGTLPQSAVLIKPLDSSAGAWFGNSCFAFSTFPIAMMIYDKMNDRAAFYNVIKSVFSIVWFVYSAFALLGYYCYGDATNTLIYFNFPSESIFRSGSAAVLACTLCFSYLIQAMPVFDYTAQAWGHSGLAEQFGVKGGLPMPVLRWTVLALTIVVAHLVPSVKVMMNTLGAVSGVLSGFIFPAVTYLVLSDRDEWLSRCQCCLVVAIGVLGAIYSVIGVL